MKEDIDVSLLMDNLIEYYYEISEEINFLNKKKKIIEKIIKRYMINECKAYSYKNNRFNISLNKKINKEHKVKQIKNLLETGGLDLIDIKYSLKVLKVFLREMNEDTSNAKEYTLRYLNFMNEKNAQSKKNLDIRSKEELILYILNDYKKLDCLVILENDTCDGFKSIESIQDLKESSYKISIKKVDK